MRVMRACVVLQYICKTVSPVDSSAAGCTQCLCLMYMCAPAAPMLSRGGFLFASHTRTCNRGFICQAFDVGTCGVHAGASVTVRKTREHNTLDHVF